MWLYVTQISAFKEKIGAFIFFKNPQSFSERFLRLVFIQILGPSAKCSSDFMFVPSSLEHLLP